MEEFGQAWNEDGSRVTENNRRDAISFISLLKVKARVAIENVILKSVHKRRDIDRTWQ